MNYKLTELVKSIVITSSLFAGTTVNSLYTELDRMRAERSGILEGFTVALGFLLFVILPIVVAYKTRIKEGDTASIRLNSFIIVIVAILLLASSILDSNSYIHHVVTELGFNVYNMKMKYNLQLSFILAIFLNRHPIVTKPEKIGEP